MKTDRIVLKEGKEKAVKQRHQWIFSGAVAKAPREMKGAILPVFSNSGDLLAHAMYNPDVSIVGRVISFGMKDPIDTIRENIRRACRLRTQFFDPLVTNAYRLINAEGDSLPGLVADFYNGTIVLQIHSLGMDKLRDLILEELIQATTPQCIYEKSTQGAREDEGLSPKEEVLYGDFKDEFEILENGIKFIVSPKRGQKTGFFLDQREMRQQVCEISSGKRVLNCFSYTGGFSLYALRGGASFVNGVEISAHADELAMRNVLLNFDSAKYQGIRSDAFQFLREDPLNYDLIILDPPAFAKKRGDVNAACRGYKEINYHALKKMPRNSLLLTCSCSAHISADLFQKVVFQAALQAERDVQIIRRHKLAIDHPINIYHPETEYLKSLLLYVA